MTDSRDSSFEAASIDTGDMVYDSDGNVLGIVSEYTDDGFGVEVVTGDSPAHATDPSAEAPGTGSEDPEDVPGKDFGEGYLMWRCDECGRMGTLEDGMPEACPDCGAPNEHIHMVQED